MVLVVVVVVVLLPGKETEEGAPNGRRNTVVTLRIDRPRSEEVPDTRAHQ